MRIRADGTYLMPVSFGETRPHKGGVFGGVWSLSTSYSTDKDALAALLPSPFEPADEPLVTVFYQKCSKVNFLAGGSYNLIGINLAAFFDGKRDQVKGNYSLVMWENNTVAITRGRELLGVPKMFADIPDPYRIEDDWRVQASENGHVLLEMILKNVRPLSEEDVATMNAEQKDNHWMSWKYIPNVNGFGASVSHATLIGAESTVVKAWSGEGTIRYGEVTWETNPENVDIIRGLKALVIKEYVGGFLTHGSSKNFRAKHSVLE
jgi:acetoacetate decarboxylase